MFKLMILAGSAALATTGLAWQSASVAGLPGQSAQTFTRTADGNWRTVYTRTDGSDAEFVYEPPNKFSWSVQTGVSAVSARDAEFRYVYTVSNSRQSAQEIGTIFLGPDIPVVAIQHAPERWDTDTRPGSSMFIAPADAGTGILPGTAATIEFTARNLPGVMTMSATANIDIPMVPGELSERQYRELGQLSRNSVLSLHAIGPTIAAGANEPELTSAVLAARVAMNYSGPLQQYRHPFAAQLIDALQQASRASSQAELRTALAQAIGFASRAVPDPWHRDMSSALRLCIETLLRADGPAR